VAEVIEELAERAGNPDLVEDPRFARSVYQMFRQQVPSNGDEPAEEEATEEGSKTWFDSATRQNQSDDIVNVGGEEVWDASAHRAIAGSARGVPCRPAGVLFARSRARIRRSVAVAGGSTWPDTAGALTRPEAGRARRPYDGRIGLELSRNQEVMPWGLP